MAIVYKCRHCGQEIGKLDQQMLDTSMLGLDQLSSADKRDMISYETNGDVQIKSICESCEESLGNHPQYHELDYFIQ
ncbi:anti-sigma-F factor Fin family protein [Lentibacillus salicampi]|uniref:Anti-sigma-F factor Fin family protein n=1 Tax=Lentibacillus salicampi TaxID=175306 RepID=A0A4Y9ACS9_9BACI|nr:anti-sigma-F factor Fin family protein [Lentibacillus salicampi]TFJ92997.1 anti-sigma-F factor Fin family protein [Lentibacillus salicampi]